MEGKEDLERQRRAWLEDIEKRIGRKLAAERERNKDKIPSGAADGAFDNMAADLSNVEAISCWTNGFWAGTMWLMYCHTRDGRYAEAARFTEGALDKAMEAFEGLSHDVGFMWLLSAVADYALTGREAARRRALHAATILAGRFNARGGFIKAWDSAWFDSGANASGVAIIDCMMNITILHWASRQTGDPRFGQIAVRHAETAMRHFVRKDGSVRHIVEFNPETGEFVRDYGGQGCAQGSSWTRGQAWGLYGFALSYLHTGRRDFLDAATKIAEYFMAHIPKSGLIPCDFMQPADCGYEDDIAAAIAACALIDLSRIEGVPNGEKCLDAAYGLLFALSEKSCDWDEGRDGLLQRCTVAYGYGAHNANIVYGDYFFVEAVFKLCGDEQFMWGRK